MTRKIICLVLWFVSFAAMGQRENKGVFNSPVMPGPSGVFVYAFDTARGLRRPVEGHFYTLSREDKSGGGFKNIATMNFPASAADLQKRLEKSLLDEILKKRRLRSVQDLYEQLKSGHLDTLGIYGSTPPVLTALGILYIDHKVTTPDPGVSYRMTVTENGVSRVLYQLSLGQIVYSSFPLFRQYRSFITDSNAQVTWYATPNRVVPKAQAPRAAYASVFTNAGSGTEHSFSVGARLYVYGRRDTFFVTYTTPTIPGSKVLLYIRPEDVAGNRGESSDTVHLLALRFGDVLSIRGLKAADTMGSVWLKWDSFPAKAWCSGIEVLKSRSAGEAYRVIDTLPLSAISYHDRKVISGNVYYYQLRPILFDLPQKGRISPALVNVRVRRAGGKMLAPQGLGIGVTASNDLRLHWEPNPELDVFAYYILRGTSPGNMQVISPALRDTAFIDSLKGLNYGITYLYAVAAMNMDMQWSDTSAPVTMQSPRSRLITTPGGIQARATPTGIRLGWEDVAKKDATVIGTLLYRRKKGDRYFVQVNKTALPGTLYTDSSELAPAIYEYGCSAVDAWGHVSMLSPLAEVDLRGGSGGTLSLRPPSDFFLRNGTAGIEISLPPLIASVGTGRTGAADTGQVRYNVYRRMVAEKKYRKIGELGTNGIAYTDRQVLSNELYAYAVTLQSGHAESGKSGEKSIRRK